MDVGQACLRKREINKWNISEHREVKCKKLVGTDYLRIWESLEKTYVLIYI